MSTMRMMFFWTLIATLSYLPKKEQSLALSSCCAFASVCLPSIQRLTCTTVTGATVTSEDRYV